MLWINSYNRDACHFHVLNINRSINEMSELMTLLSMYVYQVFGLANMKAMMQTAEIRFITVHDVFELSPNIVPVSLSPCAAALKQIKFRNKLLVISLWLLSSARYPP